MPVREGGGSRAGVAHREAQELLRILEADGWYKAGQKGSHTHLRHAVKAGLLVVPVHTGKEIGKGLLHSILKKAGLK